MKLTKENIEEIGKDFFEMKSREDLLNLLNKTKFYLFGDKSKPIQLKILTYYANPNIAGKRYVEFTIPKKSGSIRRINAPVKSLKYIQMCLNVILNIVFKPSPFAMGFVPGRSIVTNAMIHQNCRYVYNIDLSDFFHSIELHRVKAVLKLKPFNLCSEREPLAFLIANLCCTELDVNRLENGNQIAVVRSVLPQGAPTSPVLTNIVAQRLDRRLYGLAKRFNINYSRYADDITFSASMNIFKQKGEFNHELTRIIANEGFSINKDKIRLQDRCFRQEVTGLIVNEKVNIRRRYIKNIRLWLYYWERYGYEKAAQYYEQYYRKDKMYIKIVPSLEKSILGKLTFIKMVKGDKDPVFRGLWTRFETLVKRFKESKSAMLDYNIILEILFNQGITAAMEAYSKVK
ncbi:MAG: RNA-directed DNA polymerase [Bacteroidales bacterium]|nr:RNA-directed DNA polymerase [Bacteroidales bacterium]